jgi:hypothetical protein
MAELDHRLAAEIPDPLYYDDIHGRPDVPLREAPPCGAAGRA